MKRTNKHGARKAHVYGQTFDSRLEASRYLYLMAMVADGQISQLAAHPPRVHLSRARVPYKPDFYYVDRDGVPTWEDVKGYAGTAIGRWPTIKRLWKVYGPGRLLEVRRTGSAWHVSAKIDPTP